LMPNNPSFIPYLLLGELRKYTTACETYLAMRRVARLTDVTHHGR
jgi:hypothetical protein